MNTLFTTLYSMGFEARVRSMVWGVGSYFSTGKAIVVRPDGRKGYKVAFREWSYDHDGELIAETRGEWRCRRHSEVLSLVREQMDC